MSRRTVLCVGCFDLYHVGHLKHIEAAYDFGTEVVVAVTRDRSVAKGNGRPVYDENDRMTLIQGIWCVEKVLLVDSSIEALKKVKPQVFALGQDYRGKVRKEDRDYCNRNGVKIAFTNERRMSSSALYDRIRQG